MRKKRFNSKMWVVSWSIVGGFAVVIPGVMVLSEYIHPGSIFEQSNKSVSKKQKKWKAKIEDSNSALLKKPLPKAKIEDSNSALLKKPLPNLPSAPTKTKTDNEFITSYYQTIQSHYEVANPSDKSLLPSKLLQRYDALKEKATITIANINLLLDQQNNIQSLPEQLESSNEATGFVISHDDLDGTIDLKIVVAQKANNPNKFYAQDGKLNKYELAGKTVRLTGFENEKNLVKKQYAQWQTKSTLSIPNQHPVALWDPYFNLNNLSRQVNQENVIEKINGYLPGTADQKLHLLDTSLKELGYKTKITNVQIDHATNNSSKSSELRFNLSILNNQDQIVKDDFSFDQNWTGLSLKLTNFAKGQDSFLNIPIKHNFVEVISRENNNLQGWHRLDISFENLTTKQEVTWYLQAVVRKNKVVDLLKNIKNTFKAQRQDNARINSHVYAISLNPEHNSITRYETHKLYDYQTNSGSNLIAGGHENGNIIYNRQKIIDNRWNGMRKHGQFYRVQGFDGFERELKHLLSLSTFTDNNNDANNPFLA